MRVLRSYEWVIRYAVGIVVISFPSLFLRMASPEWRRGKYRSNLMTNLPPGVGRPISRFVVCACLSIAIVLATNGGVGVSRIPTSRAEVGGLKVVSNSWRTALTVNEIRFFSLVHYNRFALAYLPISHLLTVSKVQ